MATRIKVDFTLDDGKDELLRSFNVLDFIEAGLRKVKRAPKGAEILPGAKLSLTKVKVRR